MRRDAIAVAVLAALAVTGCESTQSKSARLEKTGKGKAELGTVAEGAENRDVRVGRTAVLVTPAGNAAVVELRNTGRRAQAQIPVLIDVADAKGASVFKNDTKGLQPALQQMAYLAAGQDAYWVNDQIVAASRPERVAVHVGRPAAPATAAPPRIVLEHVALDHDSTGVFATGIARNTSKVVQRNVPIYAVALKGGRVVAAGRAIEERLNPEPQRKPARFRIFFIGDPRGARLHVSAVPTVLQEAKP